MKRNLNLNISLLLLILSSSIYLNAATGPVQLCATEGYEISVKCKPYKNCSIILGHFFGDEFEIDTTTRVDENSEAKFTGSNKLHGGIYMIFIEGREQYFDFLISSSYPKFTIIAELNEEDNSLNLDFINSPENDLLLTYKKYMATKESEILRGQENLFKATNYNDSLIYIHQLSDLDKDIQEYRSNIIEKHPESFLSTLLRALQPPLLPEQLRNPVNAADSSETQYYRKEHYWDGVNFWDGRLTYTPFFNEKLERYFFEIIGLDADSVIQKIDWMMSTAVANASMERLILEKLLYGSMYHKFKWGPAVFIHLFENYIAPKSYSWLHPDLRKAFTDYAYLLMGNTKGSLAADINLPDLNGNKKSLFAIQAKYTILSFWDPTCAHCLETLPVMDSIYRSEWKANGIEIYAVAVETEGTRDNWLDIIHSNQLGQWINVYNSITEETDLAKQGAPLTLQRYDVWYYPSFFLLDAEKHFMAKKLSFPQLTELIKSILENEPR